MRIILENSLLHIKKQKKKGLKKMYLARAKVFKRNINLMFQVLQLLHA